MGAYCTKGPFGKRRFPAAFRPVGIPLTTAPKRIRSPSCQTKIEMSPLLQNRNVPMFWPLKGGQHGASSDEQEGTNPPGSVEPGEAWRAATAEGSRAFAVELSSDEAGLCSLSPG